MCNLYSHRKTQEEIRRLLKKLRDLAGNLPPQSAIFPDSIAPVIRKAEDGELELVKMRWGIPGPAIFGGRPVTNVRNTKSNHWARMLRESRCLVPATSFCEYTDNPDPKTKKKIPTWFALSESRPLFFFAGVWREWEGVRGTKADPVKGKHLVYSFLTTDPNKVVKQVHSKAMPVMLVTKEQREIWMEAPVEEAIELQHPLPDKLLKIVASGEKKD